MSAAHVIANPQPMPGASSTDGERRYWSRYLPVTATGVLLLVAIGIGAGLYDNFLTGQVLANVLITNSHLIVLAVGMTFVILTGGIDLSVGAVVALSAMIASKLLASGWTSLKQGFRQLLPMISKRCAASRIRRGRKMCQAVSSNFPRSSVVWPGPTPKTSIAAGRVFAMRSAHAFTPSWQHHRFIANINCA